MQPYFLPYLGYFQLINAVDQFIIYDDVDYIKQGWVNRNRLIISGNSQYFTVPLQKASSNQLIMNTQINQQRTAFWLKKFTKSIKQSYSKAGNLQVGLDLLNFIKQKITACDTIDQINKLTLYWVCQYLEITTPFSCSSDKIDSRELNGPERVLDICRRTGAEKYINPIGGKELYSKEEFKSKKIELAFLESDLRSEDFTHSILHSIIMVDKADIQAHLNSYRLG